MNDKATILAVDDTSESLTLLVQILTQAGYRVYPADSAELALAAVTASPPDLILLDVRMPGIDGLEACRRLKAREETRLIPIIMISAFADVKEWVEGLQMGAADYITKPFQREELLMRVKTHLTLSRANASLKQQTAELLRINERLSMALDVGNAGIWEWNPGSAEVRLDDHFHTMLGYTPGELPNTLQEWLAYHHPEDLPVWMSKAKAYLQGDSPNYESEHRIRTKAGTWGWVFTRGMLVNLAHSGSPEQFIGIAMNVTERKKAEEERDKLQVQLTQAYKMESIGRLAGGVAHDFNNLLSVILGYTDIALKQVDPDQPLYSSLQAIRTAGNRSADLTRQLLAYARNQTVVPRVLDLNETVARSLKMLQRLIGEGIQINWQPYANLWLLKMDPSQIDQILTNLFVNARDAIVDVGKITIETSNSVLDEAYCSNHAGALPGEYVRLSVSDNGCGIDKETLVHIFEPFFSTKAMGKGTGMGLATVYGAVKQNGGFIDAYSEVGLGTTFTIYLPRCAAKVEQVQKNDPAPPAVRGHETILLVEDEPEILKLTTMIFKRLGYTVVAAPTPGEAIRLAHEHAGEIDLLMTDVILPEMNGWDLAKNLLSFCPQLKCVFSSGYTADIIAHSGVLNEGVHFIQKPFSERGLAAKIREALDKK